VGVGVLAFCGQALMSRGLQLEAAATATSLYYVKVVFSYALGVGVLGEQPDYMGAAGTVLIGISTTLVMRARSTVAAAPVVDGSHLSKLDSTL